VGVLRAHGLTGYEAMSLGVLAFGDSITNGGGELQWGVALQSWALWVARGLGVPYSGYAVDGALASDVVGSQIPLFSRVAVSPDGPYAVGCLYIGVNDIREPVFDPAAYERDLREAVSFLAARCERVLLLTIPVRLGRPRVGEARVEQANTIVEAVAAGFRPSAPAAPAAGRVLVCDLRGFGARNHVMVDAVHPTAFGQIAIAERALRTLDLPVRVWPHTLITYNPSRLNRLRGDLTLTYRHLKSFPATFRAVLDRLSGSSRT
jgi:lysophospholipase L1-like esterase